MRRQDRPTDRLTAREREVLSLMAEGRSNAGIAECLVVSESAVAKHINSIFTKLDRSPTERPIGRSSPCWVPGLCQLRRAELI